MTKRLVFALCFLSITVLFITCSPKSSHDEMIALLAKVDRENSVPENTLNPTAKLAYLESMMNLPNGSPSKMQRWKFMKGHVLLELGRETEAIAIYEELVASGSIPDQNVALKELAIAYLRNGERSNCILGHESESCLLPIQGAGIHLDVRGSSKAIDTYLKILAVDPTDLESKWLLNLAYMTLGQYPQHVPKEYFIPGLEGDTTVKVKPFQDIAGDLALSVDNMSGGTIVDDFDNDGYLDIVTSGMDLTDEMHFFKNMTNGLFADESEKSGLKSMHGGLNIMQADYDNDGDKDILVLRGGWRGNFGDEPNSLLQNQGDGSFKDVTTTSGLLSFQPTQTATWNDFNNDGWLDLFIGNETVGTQGSKVFPCELYMSNGDGTFRNTAHQSKCDVELFVKGVASGDYDNDGWKDIFISTLNGRRLLLRNKGVKGADVEFEDVTLGAGLANEKNNTFPGWFWDYDNDGWLDIFVCDYTVGNSLANDAAAEKLNIPAGSPDKMLLYHNNHDGTFTNVAGKTGLTKVVFAMGSNFGDIDNDGFLDMYLGSGSPHYQSLVPNKMFKNMGGTGFADVTTSARVGHLQKGHGVSFADIDNDGDQDVYIDMGGAFVGDAYQNSFFLNPGQSDNNWICFNLRGSSVNRDAIGSQVKLTFTENGVKRSVYRDVNSGGSFGASPLRREIGIGTASVIDEVEIKWHGSNKIQRFNNVQPNQFLEITEGKDDMQKVNLKKLNWVLVDPICKPEGKNF